MTKEERSQYNKNYRANNLEKLITACRVYKENNKEKLKKYKKEYDKNNIENNKKYKESHKEKLKLYQKEYGKDYHKNRVKIDIQYKLSCTLRSRFNRALNGNFKSGSAVKDLGCSIPEFKLYIESLFTEGMSWDNHCRSGWHVDHILPLTSFDLTDREQLLKAVNYTNLQPLWFKDNLSKGNKTLHHIK